MLSALFSAGPTGHAMIYWTYPVNMRLAGRHILRDEILEATDNYEIIESYPQDKYLPSYLVWATSGSDPFHVLFAADVANDNVRIVTACRPNLDEWEPGLKSRKGQTIPCLRKSRRCSQESTRRWNLKSSRSPA